MRSKGFTLIEVTVAVAIIAIVITGVSAVLARLPMNARQARDQSLALTMARTQIERLRGAGYGALPASGPFTDPLLASLPGAAASTAVSSYSARTKQASVSVSWLEAGQIAAVVLTTLVTQDAGLP
ncbi:prepilin-type N-terminal cleavage/methylation domain-containing protein [Candidatus Kaiserbacteria bacterium]|nr:prepilin-type N-terminal cleavage/methylation domain-containing protein [Candidatus Kaiserbacteria bacterium]